ncbi:MAG TPA: carboxymuconolactone decarboxylase family protein [Acetobacteraceae bacterium]|jgi:AhpD family alkylhydroperoxidase|nr:carboxymuconolactone decarboxylase family protein [Acetobacteraceae bacterium]
MRKSPVALKALLALQDALAEVSIDRVTRGRIALAVAEANGCDYCLSRATHVARTVLGLDDAEITANRNGASNDVVAEAAVRFAAQLVRQRGRVTDEDRAALHAAGFTDAQALEIVALVVVNTWTNYANGVAATEIDFPHIAARKAL